MTKVLLDTGHFRNTVGQHTLGHIDCPVCEGSRTMLLSRISPSLPFREAAQLWLESRSAKSSIRNIRARYIRENTERSYVQYIASLTLFFEDMPMNNIHIGHIDAYKDARLAGDPPFIRKRRPNKNVVPAPSPVQPKKVNQELSIFKMIMERAGCWSQEIDDNYEPFLEQESDLRRALTFDERRHWLAVAASNPRWSIINWYSVIAFETSMGTNEMRSLRIGDVNLFHQTISIPPEGGKNNARIRTVPLVTGDALWAAEKLLERAKSLGASSPLHFLFPYRRPPYPFDPTRHMTVAGIRVQWDEMRSESGLIDFTQYRTRHTALTHWAEGGMRITDMMALAGHLTPRQTLHYARISEGALRKSLEGALHRKGPESVNVEQQTWARAW